MLDLKRYAPLERCRLVKYDHFSKTLEQSFEKQEVGEENVIWRSCVAELYLMNFVKSLLGQLLHYMQFMEILSVCVCIEGYSG